MKRNNTTRIKITDSEDLDLEKIGNKIVEIYRDISVKAKMLEINNTDSKQLKKCMKVRAFLFRKSSKRSLDSTSRSRRSGS